jgi:pyrimidine operon attenuation protein/uracil phosphoribosyltransferase
LKTILDTQQLRLTIQRLSCHIAENREDMRNVAIIGIQPRGVKLSDRLVQHLREQWPADEILYGLLDITFYRDDIRRELHQPNRTDIPFALEGKKVILVDDVLYTGRTVRAALDALQDFGRPSRVELCVLIDRRFNRELPIQPDYCGRSIDSLMTQEVRVSWESENVELLDKELPDKS